MTEDELAEVLAQPPRSLRAALRPLRRFLIGPERLDIFHHSLREFAAGEFSAAELAELRNAFAGWCRAYGARGWPPETPVYILEHCADHYAETDPRAAVALPDRAWLTRQRERFGTATGFIRDVATAIDLAEGGVAAGFWKRGAGIGLPLRGFVFPDAPVTDLARFLNPANGPAHTLL